MTRRLAAERAGELEARLAAVGVAGYLLSVLPRDAQRPEQPAATSSLRLARPGVFHRRHIPQVQYVREQILRRLEHAPNKTLRRDDLLSVDHLPSFAREDELPMRRLLGRVRHLLNGFARNEVLPLVAMTAHVEFGDVAAADAHVQP